MDDRPLERLKTGLTGVLLGTAVGDAIGLPREGLSRRRGNRIFGDTLEHRFFLGRGMTSDDTEHTAMVAQALLRSPDDPDRFARSLAWRFRGWLLGLPAGVGFATLRSILKLWLGWSPAKSGVWSAGNGPAMRSALLGVALGDEPEKLDRYVRASTRLTHRDPKAEIGARAIALAAHAGYRKGTELDGPSFLAHLPERLPDPDEDFLKRLERCREHLEADRPPEDLAAAMDLDTGITGYIYDTVPVALFCWLRSPNDFRRVVETTIRLGGDADTTGAIAGAIAGATTGPDAIPAPWLDNIIEWPRSTTWLKNLAARLAEALTKPEENPGPQPLLWPALLPRNLFFLTIVLLHGLRRLLPPY